MPFVTLRTGRRQAWTKIRRPNRQASFGPMPEWEAHSGEAKRKK